MRRLITLVLISGSFLFFGIGKASAATYFIDGSLGANCAGGAGTSYDPVARTCSTSGGQKAFVGFSTTYIPNWTLTMGDTVNVRGAGGAFNGIYKIKDYSLAVTASSGKTLTIQPYGYGSSPESVTLDIDSTAATYAFTINVSTVSTVLFQGFATTNSGAVAKPLMIFGNGTLYWTDGSIDYGGATGPTYGVFQEPGTSYGASTVYLQRNIIANETTNRAFITASDSSTYVTNFYLSGNEVFNVYQLASLNRSSTGVGTYSLVNNTGAYITGAWLLANSTNGAANITNENNVVVLHGTAAGVSLSDGIMSSIGTTSSYTADHNVYYRDGTLTTNTPFENIVLGTNYFVPADSTERFINPGFLNYTIGSSTYPGVGNLALASNSKITGMGNNTVLPGGGDVTGATWVTNSIGAYSNPSATAPTLSLTPNTADLSGDSIAAAVGASSTAASAYSIFSTLSGVTVPDETKCAFSGLTTIGWHWVADYCAYNNTPSAIFTEIGINNFPTGTFSPTYSTAAILSAQIGNTMTKLAGYGIRPISLGALSTWGTLSGVIAQNATTVDVFNADMQTICATNSWSYDSWLDRMRYFNPPSSPTNYVTGWWAPCTNGTACMGGGGNPLSVSGGTYRDLSNVGYTVHPNDSGYYVGGSLMENLYFKRIDYWVNDSTGTVTGPATYRNPITVAGLNAATAIPPGQTGRTITVVGSTNTTFTTPSAGASGKLLTLLHGTFNAGINISQPYWKLIYNVIAGKDSADNSLTISGSNVEANNVSIAGSTSSGISVNENTTLKNIAVKESSGTSLTVASGKTVTGSHNCFNSSTQSGSGTYSDSGNPWSCNPLFTSSSDFHLLPTSPAINAGTWVGLFYDADNNPVRGFPDIGAYERQDQMLGF